LMMHRAPMVRARPRKNQKVAIMGTSPCRG
jgi:hypothetical protein